MNDPYAAFSSNPQTNAVLSTPAVPAMSQPVAPTPTQVSATDRLEQLLKQLQDEQLVPDSPAAAPELTRDASQDFSAALASMPEPPVAPQLSDTTSPALRSLDNVVKTIGDQYVMGQPKLTELLELAKATATTVEKPAEVKPFTPNPVTSALPSTSPMQIDKPNGAMAWPSQPAAPMAAPKITVMPPASEVVQSTAVVTPLPVASPSSPTPVVVSAATEESELVRKPRVLRQYLQNLASHLKERGKLSLSNYTKVSVVRA